MATTDDDCRLRGPGRSPGPPAPSSTVYRVPATGWDSRPGPEGSVSTRPKRQVRPGAPSELGWLATSTRRLPLGRASPRGGGARGAERERSALHTRPRLSAPWVTRPHLSTLLPGHFEPDRTTVDTRSDMSTCVHHGRPAPGRANTDVSTRVHSCHRAQIATPGDLPDPGLLPHPSGPGLSAIPRHHFPTKCGGSPNAESGDPGGRPGAGGRP